MKKGISLFFQILIFLLTATTVIGLTYIIGRPYLIGNNLSGNDAYSFYSVALWVNRYFPHVPFWYPLAGGGVSVVSGYPVFAAYLVAIITRISSLDLVQSFRLLGFLSVPFLALGVFFLCLLRLPIKSGFSRAVLGLIAAIFVVVSPNSWLWLTRWGFYAESISYIFVPWAILFFDLFLENAIEGKRGWGYRIGILGSVSFVLLSFLTHFLSLASLVIFFGVVAIVRFNKKIITPGIILGIFVFGVLFFKLSGYQFYMNQVASGGFAGYGRMAYSEMLNNTLPLHMWLSLLSPTTIKDPHALIFDMRFPLYVWILFGVGLVFSIKKSKKIFSFAIYGLLGLILSSVLPIKYFVSGIPVLSFIANLMEDRGFLIIARVIVPVVAVYGSYVIWEIVFKKVWAGTILAVLGITTLVFFFYNTPYKYPFVIGTGAFGGISDTRDLWNRLPHTSELLYNTDTKLLLDNPENTLADFKYMNSLCLLTNLKLVDPGSVCDIYLKDKNLIYPDAKLISETKLICDQNVKNGTYSEKYKYCEAFYLPLKDQLNPNNWPVFTISSDTLGKKKEVSDIFSGISLNENFRFDLSGFTGGSIMATSLITQNSQIQLYINTLSLIYNSWNYQSQVMYSNLAATQKPGVLTELGKWFGLNYIYLRGSELEPKAYWQTDSNWVKIGNSVTGGWEKFNIPVGLATWDNRPKILIVTDVKRGLYDQTFRFATWGAIPFDKFNIITGKKSIDSYSLTDLKKYDVIFMRGYSYSSRSKAFNLLNGYVKDGGKLIFDTGWQFETPDYILSKAPDFMPFGSLVWKNLNTDSNFSEANFGDLKYGDLSWGVSVAQNLKPTAKVNLSYNGEPLVVSGSYGKGNVTWIGFNIVAHAIAKDSQNEALFFNTLITNIVGENSVSNLNMSYKRISPDKVEFGLDSSSDTRSGIYFRESYFPYWHANLVSGNKKTSLKIEKAGPGFMYINLPPVKMGDKVILEVKISVWQKIADLISIIAGITLLIYFINPSIFSKINLPKFKFKSYKFKQSNDEDEDY